VFAIVSTNPNLCARFHDVALEDGSKMQMHALNLTHLAPKLLCGFFRITRAKAKLTSCLASLRCCGLLEENTHISNGQDISSTKMTHT